VTKESEVEIQAIEQQLHQAISFGSTILTHDLIFQPNQWKAHVAARRLAKNRPDIKWLHWVHSATDMGVRNKVKQYRKELSSKFPNSLLVAMHPEEINRKGSLYGYERDEIVVVPNAIDFAQDYHSAAQQAIEKFDLWQADIISVYPIRLDAGKQPEIIIEIFEQLRLMGYDARVVIVDFHSVAGDKAKYRDRLRNDFVYFTSGLEGEEDGNPFRYCLPHQAVMDLMQFGDVLVHPSRSESDPLVVPEAAWYRLGLVLNFDLPLFRLWDGLATFGKFSSNIDTNTGGVGETNTEYGNRQEYMKMIAGAIAYQMEHNPVLAGHVKMRKERSLQGVWPKLWAAISVQMNLGN
jgi:glycosyltransferase involved in cell wall biosynthesis